MKLYILYWLIVYDAWCEGRMKALLIWLEEWFSISQKHIEEGMIVLYQGLLMPSWKWKLPWLGVNIFSALFIVSTMIWLHRKPETFPRDSKVLSRITPSESDVSSNLPFVVQFSAFRSAASYNGLLLCYRADRLSCLFLRDGYPI